MNAGIEIVDRLDDALERLRFIDRLLCAWDVERCEVDDETLTGLGAFVEDAATLVAQASRELARQIRLKDTTPTT